VMLKIYNIGQNMLIVQLMKILRILTVGKPIEHGSME